MSQATPSVMFTVVMILISVGFLSLFLAAVVKDLRMRKTRKERIDRMRNQAKRLEDLHARRKGRRAQNSGDGGLVSFPTAAGSR